MIKKISVAAALATAATVTTVLLTQPTPWVQHRGVYYSGRPIYPCAKFVAENYQDMVAPEAIDSLKSYNSKIRVYNYKSGTDDYLYKGDLTPHPQGLRMKAICDSLGVPFESAYLHYADTTVVSVWDNTGKHTQLYLPGDRVEVYQGGHQNAGYRYACNFNTPDATTAHIVLWSEVANVRSPKGRSYDGIFLDNSGCILYNYGDPILKGGTVLEAGLRIGSPAFNTWHWAQFSVALAKFRVLLNARNQFLAINVANTWTDGYLVSAVCNYAVQEFVGNQQRDTWPATSELIRRHNLAAANQIGLWTSAAGDTATYCDPDCSWDQITYNCLAYFLTYCDMNMRYSSAHVQDLTWPYVKSWPYHVISRAEKSASAIGHPTADAELWMAGTLPNGHKYELYLRPFTKGVVVSRQRIPWNGKVEEVVKFKRPSQMMLISPQGGAMSTPDSIAVQNGGGAIMRFAG